MPYDDSKKECRECEVKETCKDIGCKTCNVPRCHYDGCPRKCGQL